MIGHPFSDGPLPFGQIVDCGLVEYHEFACSVETFEWLRGGAMTHLNGEPVTLSIADWPSPHNVIVKAVTPSWYGRRFGLPTPADALAA